MANSASTYYDPSLVSKEEAEQQQAEQSEKIGHAFSAAHFIQNAFGVSDKDLEALHTADANLSEVLFDEKTAQGIKKNLDSKNWSQKGAIGLHLDVDQLALAANAAVEAHEKVGKNASLQQKTEKLHNDVWQTIEQDHIRNIAFSSSNFTQEEAKEAIKRARIIAKDPNISLDDSILQATQEIARRKKITLDEKTEKVIRNSAGQSSRGLENDIANLAKDREAFVRTSIIEHHVTYDLTGKQKEILKNAPPKKIAKFQELLQTASRGQPVNPQAFFAELEANGIKLSKKQKEIIEKSLPKTISAIREKNEQTASLQGQIPQSAPKTAADFEELVRLDLEESKKTILERKAKLTAKQESNIPLTKAEKAELQRLQQAQLAHTRIQKTLTDPKAQRKIAALPPDHQQQFRKRISGFHSGIKEGKPIEPFLSPNDWLFRKFKPTPAISPVPSLPSSLPTKVGGFRFPKLNLPGFFPKIGNIFKGGAGNFLKGLGGKVLSSALVKGLGGLLTGGLLTAASFLGDIANRIGKLFGIDAKKELKWATKVAFFAVICILGLLVFAIVLTIIHFTNLACSVPIIGCDSIEIIKRLNPILPIP
ncbi:hypothetical protein HY407_03015 [Candidatus Gottesmanbacteria bacterium]|nr:hypothetical protein [Candidatus Gottesmanbacteria bacterium]